MPNYANSSVYKLLKQDDYDNKNIYIGSTTNFKVRKNNHKTCCNNDNAKSYNLKVYQFIRDNGGWTEWTMIQLEAFPCETKKELQNRERYWIEQLKPVLNIEIPTKTLTEYNKEYRDNNKEKLVENYNIYYDKNKEVILEKKKEKITCECGSIVCKHTLAKHKRTQTHIKWIEEKNNIIE